MEPKNDRSNKNSNSTQQPGTPMKEDNNKRFPDKAGHQWSSKVATDNVAHNKTDKSDKMDKAKNSNCNGSSK